MANTVQLTNTGYLTLTTLTNSVTAAVVTDATVTAQLYYVSAAGVETAAGDAVTLPHIAAGTYAAPEPAATVDAYFTVNAPYRIKYTAVSGSSTGTWNVRGYVLERGAT